MRMVRSFFVGMTVGCVVLGSLMVLGSGSPVSAQSAPECVFEDPVTGAALDLEADPITLGPLGFDCDGPGVVTFGYSLQDATGFGGYAMERPDPRTDPIVEYFGVADPAGAWWNVSTNSSGDCSIDVNPETPYQFGGFCDGGPPSGGVDVTMSLHFAEPIIAISGQNLGTDQALVSVSVGPYSAPPSSTTTTTEPPVSEPGEGVPWREGENVDLVQGSFVAGCLVLFTLAYLAGRS